jgi:hypothetical protein
VNAAEHFDWAKGRAMEYVEMGDGESAMASLVSDLGKHEGTAGILTEDLMFLFAGEVTIGGARGARSFIEGLPRPHPAESSFAPAALLKDSPDPMFPEGEGVVIVDHGPVRPPYGSPEREAYDRQNGGAS